MTDDAQVEMHTSGSTSIAGMLSHVNLDSHAVKFLVTSQWIIQNLFGSIEIKSNRANGQCDTWSSTSFGNNILSRTRWQGWEGWGESGENLLVVRRFPGWYLHEYFMSHLVRSPHLPASRSFGCPAQGEIENKSIRSHWKIVEGHFWALWHSSCLLDCFWGTVTLVYSFHHQVGC